MTVKRGSQHRAARRKLLAYADTCFWCGTPISDALPVGHPKKATADHLIPSADGGLDVLENYVASCHRCNCRKGKRSGRFLSTDLVTPGDW